MVCQSSDRGLDDHHSQRDYQKGDDARQKNQRSGRQKTIDEHPKDRLIPHLVCREEWVSTCLPVADTAPPA